MEDDQNCVYLLNTSYSWQPHTKICDLSFYSMSLLHGLDCKGMEPEYFLTASKSWQPEEKISDLSFYSNSLIQRRTRSHSKNKGEACLNNASKSQNISSNLLLVDKSTCNEELSTESSLATPLKTNHLLVPNQLMNTPDCTHVTNKCPTCSKEFTRKCNLTSHIRLHTGERPYKCSICSKGFKRREHLTTHIRLHSGERPYKCLTCSKEFAYKHQLTAHFILHTGVKPYKCPTCSKEFTLKCNLTTHMRLHTGERPYKCSICSKEFADRSNLRRHIRLHRD